MSREFQFLPIATVTVEDDGTATLEIDWSQSSQGEFLPDQAGPGSDHLQNAATEIVCNFLDNKLPGEEPIVLPGHIQFPTPEARCDCGHNFASHDDDVAGCPDLGRCAECGPAAAPEPARFRDLAIGQTFDFIDDSRPHLNSFFERCTKISARSYTWQGWDWENGGKRDYSTRVGTINAGVFHWGPSREVSR